MNDDIKPLSNNPMELASVQFTPTLDTGAYTANDVLFAVTKLPGYYRSGYIRYITMIDKDDVASESATLYFFNSAVTTFGAANAAPAPSDADLSQLLCVAGPVVASVDLGGAKYGVLAGLSVPFEVQTAGALYVAATTATALTHTASGLVFNITIEKWL